MSARASCDASRIIWVRAADSSFPYLRWISCRRATAVPSGRLSSLRSNFAANIAGQACVALIQLLVIPIYVRLLGIEAYGLIGFFVALQATVQVLDLGVSATVTRELAKSTATSLVDAPSLVITAAASYLRLPLLISL